MQWVRLILPQRVGPESSIRRDKFPLFICIHQLVDVLTVSPVAELRFAIDVSYHSNADFPRYWLSLRESRAPEALQRCSRG